MKQLSNIALVLAAGVICFCGLIRTVFSPKLFNAYENRYAYQVAAPSVSSYLEGTFQDSVEDALTDQVQLAQAMKKAYNTASNGCLSLVLRRLVALHPDTYISLGDCYLYNQNIVYPPYTLSDITWSLEQRAAHLNQCFAAYPDVDFYAFYIEKDTDINFETGEKVGASDYVLGQLQLPDSHKDIFRINSFGEFSDLFYATDHHWNYKGSYAGYLQLHSLLGIQEPALEPTDTVTFSGTFSGSKALTTGTQGVLTEPFTAYTYAYPSMSVTIDGAPTEDYGDAAGFLDGSNTGTLSYGGFYGGDNGETIFDTGLTDRENILVVGESYDNAILKLLASHYHRTYSVDLRYYENSMGKRFQLKDYLEEHDIRKVLLIGNIDYYTMEAFCLED
jgi:hypothetical protein